MNKGIEIKREREKIMVSQMIALYCRNKHGKRQGLCPDCGHWIHTRGSGATNARSWKQRLSVLTVRCIAVSPK